MNTFIAVACGGAFGAMGRYGLNLLMTQKIVSTFPFGIFTVNILGSILMGICFALITTLWDGSQTLKAFLIVGFFGSFTTFSTFSLDTVQLIERQSYGEAFFYMFGTVLFSVGGLFLGLILTRQMIA